MNNVPRGLVIRIALLCFVFVAWAFAQGTGGYFVAAEQIEAVKNPEAEMHQQFIYRVNQGNGFAYYRVPMNDLLYGTKKAFLWPKEISAKQKAILQLSEDEVIYNDRLILAESESLTASIKGKKIPLLSIKRPGIVLLSSPQPVEVFRIDSKGLGAGKKLPAFHYTLDDTTVMLMAKWAGHYAAEIDPYISRGSFKQIDVRLNPLPTLLMAARPVQMDLEEISSDSLRIRAADSLMQVTRLYLSEDSARIEQFIAGVRQGASPLQPKKPYESEEVFAIRSRLWQQELQNAEQHARAANRLDRFLIPLHERLEVLAAYRSNVQTSRSWKGDGAQRALLKRLLWGRLFLQSYATMGRQLPAETTDPGPSQMWGTGGSIGHFAHLWGRSALVSRIEFSHNEWLYHEGVSNASQQNSAGLGIGWALPLAVAASGENAASVRGVVVQTQIGANVLWRDTKINAPQDSQSFSEPWQPAYGGWVSLQFLFTRLPLSWDLEYQWTHDGYGDLRTGLSLPLWFLPRFAKGRS